MWWKNSNYLDRCFWWIFLCLCLNNERNFMTAEYELGKDELLLWVFEKEL